jgi:hypothetical protein
MVVQFLAPIYAIAFGMLGARMLIEYGLGKLMDKFFPAKPKKLKLKVRLLPAAGVAGLQYTSARKEIPKSGELKQECMFTMINSSGPGGNKNPGPTHCKKNAVFIHCAKA